MPSGLAAGYSFSCLDHTSQGAGRRPQVIDLYQRAQAAGRRLSISPDISPIYKAAGRRSSIREPLISITDAPSNKNRSEVEGSFAKKKLAPPQRECEQCQAICDLDTDIRPASLHQCGFQSFRSAFSLAGFVSIASTVIVLSLASSTLFISAKAWG